MCGIAGIYHFDPERNVDYALLKRMTDSIRHRGPDGEGFFISKNIGLGHRRLSIIDLQTGDQPMYNNDKSMVIVLNGEIYNYIEIKQELERLGHQFRTTSDTEVALKAYEQWGIDCQKKFNGMWAFAIWDSRLKRLFISRDRIGEKPLCYTTWNNSLAFASEMKSLFEFGVKKEYSTEFLELYLFLTNIPAPYTFFKNIHKLNPGHYLLVQGDSIKDYKYWDLEEFDENDMIQSKPIVYEQFKYLLEDSVKIRMRSDVEFGAFLSGGLDSSTIVSIMANTNSNTTNTFTIGFNDKYYDERALAKQVASLYKTKHYENTVEPDVFSVSLNEISHYFDEPFGDSSSIPTYYVSRYAREKIKMALTGDGGDEVLSGYNAYLGLKIAEQYSKLPSPLQKSVPYLSSKLSYFLTGKPRYLMNRISRISATASLSLNERIKIKSPYTDHKNIKALTKHLSGIIKIEDFLEDFMIKCPYKSDFYKLMYFNFKHTLPDDILVKVDRMSMANSLETRIPFLDHRLIEFMVRVDKNIKMAGWERKSILRNTYGQQLPASLLKAPKKGFGIPLREWFKGNSFQESLKELSTGELFGLDKQIIANTIQDNIKGRADHGNFLWQLFSLQKMITGK